MTRPLNFNKEDVLQKALDLFWDKGYESTSLQDLLKAMHLSKSSFYQTFVNKEELFKTCLESYRLTLGETLSKEWEEADSAYLFLEAYLIDIAMDRHKDRWKGCLMMNTAIEFAHRHSDIAKIVTEALNELQSFLKNVLTKAQEEGDLPESKSPDDMAHFLLMSISGLKNLAKAGLSSKDLLISVKQTLIALAS